VLEDAWLGERLGRPAFTLEEGDRSLDAGPGFYQAKVDCADVQRVGDLERAGMRVVDVNVTLRRPASPGPDAPGEVRDGAEADRDAVLGIAERDYTVSRFHLDPEIPDARARDIKRSWVDGFFSGARGDRLLVAPAEGRVAGFHLILDGDDARTVDLIAVEDGARGRGLGTALLAALFAMRPERDVLVGTQVSNRASLRLYQRLGFQVADTRYVLHGHTA
jgi:ribosomal protein S18 acetylase RimI-like enzyme